MRVILINIYIVLLLGLFPLWGMADITFDGSMGYQGTLSGKQIDISAQLGKQQGNNLFHSFEHFSIETGQQVTFSGAENIQHIISRVTGTQASYIDGILQSTIEGADFWFINPNGIFFTDNAQLDISGAFYASTAESILFSDNIRFSSRDNFVQLSVASPEAFGFLNAPIADITLQSTQLAVPLGQHVVLAGKGITLQDSNIYAPEGKIDLYAIHSTGKVLPVYRSVKDVNIFDIITINGRPVKNNNSQGFIANLDVSGTQAGSILIYAKDVFLQQGIIANNRLSGTTENIPEQAKITLKLSDTLELKDNALIGSNNFNDTANSANIFITVKEMLLEKNSSVSSVALAKGNGGNITIKAKEIVLDNGGIQVASSASGHAGSLTMRVESISLQNNAVIQTDSFAQGNGGEITIEAQKSVLLNEENKSSRNNSGIVANVLGAGNGGNITIVTPLLVLQNGTVIRAFVFPSATGNSGNISLQTDRLDIYSGSEIDARTSGTGNGGNIFIDSKQVEMRGQLTPTNATLIYPSTITANTLGKGDSGNIQMQAQTLVMTDQASISVASKSPGTGNAGSVFIMLQGILLDNATLSSSTREGKGGSITIQAENITLQESEINVLSAGKGESGNISLQAKTIQLQQDNIITAESQGSGDGGNIIIAANTVQLQDSEIIANSLASGDAGNISLDAKTLVIHNGKINVATKAQGQGGEIRLNNQQLWMNKNAKISASSEGQGTGGAIYITSQQIDIKENSAIVVNSNANGDAGNISIKSDNMALQQANIEAISTDKAKGGEIVLQIQALHLSAQSRITASTKQQGDAGTITIEGEYTVIENNSSIQSNTLGAGNSGKITINMIDRLLLQSGGKIIADTQGTGNGGTITLTAQHLAIGDKESAIIASTENTGKGGAILINTESLLLKNNAQIIASTQGQGDAGEIRINNKNTFLLEGKGTRISSNAENASEGTGGNIVIQAQHLKLQDAAIISASSKGTGDAGNISLEGDNLSMQTGMMITQAEQSAGGNIDLSLQQQGYLVNATISASAKGSTDANKGGNIAIKGKHQGTQFIILNNAKIIAKANAGSGGNITLQAGEYIASAESQIDASSQLGVDGRIAIKAPSNDLRAATSRLNAGSLEKTKWNISECLIGSHNKSTLHIPAQLLLYNKPDRYL